MKAISPVGSGEGGVGKSSGTGGLTGSMFEEMRIRPVSTLSRRSHHSGWFSKRGFVTPAMYPGLKSQEIYERRGYCSMSSSTFERSV